MDKTKECFVSAKKAEEKGKKHKGLYKNIKIYKEISSLPLKYSPHVQSLRFFLSRSF